MLNKICVKELAELSIFFFFLNGIPEVNQKILEDKKFKQQNSMYSKGFNNSLWFRPDFENFMQIKLTTILKGSTTLWVSMCKDQPHSLLSTI